ncbi:MAG: XdhC family protein [Pseudomonadota bacterium]
MKETETAPEQALAWARGGTGAALATVVETWGSAPRRAGSQMVVSGAGEMMGSVSGGCVEGAVVVEAMEALEDGAPRLLEYGVSDGDAFAVGLACGGTIRVLVEPVGPAMPTEMLEALVAARAARTPAAYVVDLESWDRRLDHDGHADRFARDRTGVDADGRTFVAIHNPPLRLAIVGGVHIAQALATMARLSGYDVTLIDPRLAFASEARFPGETLSHQWPDAALEQLGLDPHTAVVCLTHDAKLDDPALIRALRSDAFYVGALGSPRTHAKRVERLKAEGLTDAEIGRLHAPIGLDIGAKSPAEIAVSILAQITERLRRPETRSGMATR